MFFSPASFHTNANNEQWAQEAPKNEIGESASVLCWRTVEVLTRLIFACDFFTVTEINKLHCCRSPTDPQNIKVQSKMLHKGKYTAFSLFPFLRLQPATRQKHEQLQQPMHFAVSPLQRFMGRQLIFTTLFGKCHPWGQPASPFSHG